MVNYRFENSECSALVRNLCYINPFLDLCANVSVCKFE